MLLVGVRGLIETQRARFAMSTDDENLYAPPQFRTFSTAILHAPLRGLESIELNVLEETHVFGVCADTLQHLIQNRYWALFFDAFLIPDVFRNPIGVWEFKRDSSRDLFCIAGIPDGRYATENYLESQIEIQQGKVLLVFADSELSISKWRWEKFDSDGSGFPTSYNTRFEVKLWPPDKT